MRLRIISGHLKGRVLALNGNPAACRPTADRVRESVAQILGASVAEAVVADLCAGSGACGFEFLSRGAREVHFVEAHAGRARAIRAAALRFGVAGQVTVWTEDIRRFVGRRRGSFDIVYYDPPYDDDNLAGLIPRVLRLVATGGVLVHERAARRAAMKLSGEGGIRLTDTRVYGSSAVDFYTVTALAPSDAL